jgi:hypothetical protein
MTISLEARVLAALDRRDIPPLARREIYNAICGPSSQTPFKVAWEALLAPLQAHIVGLQSNLSHSSSNLRAARIEYMSLIKKAREDIRAANHNLPIPQDKARWQEWIPQATRLRVIATFQHLYAVHSTRGRKLIPFAPQTYVLDNLERIRRAKAAIEAERRGAESVRGTQPLLCALMLCACRMAERALRDYEEGLDDGTLHPYETPAKVNWRHYCTHAMRARVKDGLADPSTIVPDGLNSFLGDKQH